MEDTRQWRLTGLEILGVGEEPAVVRFRYLPPNRCKIMSTVFFTADTHFFHKGILNFVPEYRPFKNIAQHNRTLIENWNSVVGKKDHVYHLGDVCFGPVENLKIVEELNGVKHLILGNHDRYDIREYIKHFHSISGPKSKFGWWLSHIPIHPTEFYGKVFNIHGHTHGKCLADQRYVNLCVEHWGLTPVSIDILRDRLKKIKIEMNRELPKTLGEAI